MTLKINTGDQDKDIVKKCRRGKSKDPKKQCIENSKETHTTLNHTSVCFLFVPRNCIRYLLVLLVAENIGHGMVHGIAGGGVKGNSNDCVEADQHGAFEVVGFAVLDSVGDDKNGDGERHGLDCTGLADCIFSLELGRSTYTSRIAESCPCP